MEQPVSARQIDSKNPPWTHISFKHVCGGLRFPGVHQVLLFSKKNDQITREANMFDIHGTYPLLERIALAGVYCSLIFLLVYSPLTVNFGLKLLSHFKGSVQLLFCLECLMF